MNQIPSHALDLNEVLLVELHHRFYNSLQVLSSMASRLMRGDISLEASRQAATELQNRITLLGELHRLLAQPHGDDLRHACETLCRTLASAYDRQDVNLRLTLPAGPMSTSVCRGFMLMLAELVTNALKHAPSEIPLDLDVVLKSSRLGYDLRVRSPAPAAESDLAPTPRVASQLAARFGGILTAHTRDGYNVHVTLQAV